MENKTARILATAHGRGFVRTKLGRVLMSICLMGFCMAMQAEEKVVSLDSCLSLAQAHNAQLQSSQLERLAAEEIKRQAFTKYFPQVFVSSFAFHSLKPNFDMGIDDIKNEDVRNLLNSLYNLLGTDAGIDRSITYLNYGAMAGVTAIQPIYMGGQIVNGNKLAKVNIEAKEAEYKITERDKLKEVEETYWLVVGLEDKLKTISSAKQLIDTIDKNLSLAVGAGLTLSNEQLKLTIRRNELAEQQMQLEHGIELASRLLCIEVGVDSIMVDTTLLRRMFSEAEEKNSGETDFRENRYESELHLLGLGYEAARLEKKMIIGKTLPQVAFGASYTYNNFFDKNTFNGTLFVTVHIPLSGWWETAHKIKEADYRIQKSQIEQNYLTQKLMLKQEKEDMEREEARFKMENATAVIASAEERLRLVTLNYNAGLTTVSELLEAQTTLLQAKNKLTDLRIEYLLNN